MADEAALARSEPRERLDRRAVGLWRLGGAMWSAVLLAMVWAARLAFGTILRAGDAPAWAVRLVDLLPWISLILLPGLLVWLGPSLRWRWWRYEIHETEVDLQRGILYITRTLVPMARIQHVDTRQGPVERQLGLATVIFYTAAGAHRIPALSEEVAASLRDRIARLAQLARDEVM